MTVINALLVDDVEENLVALEALVRPLGLNALKASSGEEALELLLDHEVALALVDVQMPGMDGFELAELMRGTERTRAIPIVFLTAGRDPARAFKGYEAGAVDFLYKPLDPRVLASKVSVFVDLYRQRLQLAEKVHALEESLRLNDLLMAVVGHDLRSPLAAVHMQAEILLLRPDLDDKVRAGARRIRNAAGRMRGLVADLTELSRARSGQALLLERTACDLGEIAHKAVEEQEAQGRRVVIEVQGDARGSWDAGRLAQVVTNLLTNALEHGQPHEPVELVVAGAGEGAVALVVRNGGHISPERQASIFEPFQTSRRPGDRRGLGLGLYIVRQIVESHGGRIELESSPEAGTAFRVELPRGAPGMGASSSVA